MLQNEVIFWKNKWLAEKGLKQFSDHPISKMFLSNIQEGSAKIEHSNRL